MRSKTRYRRRWAAGGAAVLAAAAVTWLVWPAAPSAPSTPEVRARHYRDVDACLLTDDAGITGTPAAEVWAGLRDVSDATRVRISYVPAVGEPGPYLASLLNRKCVVVVAVGAGPVAAASSAAAKAADRHFVVVGEGAAGGANLVRVPATADVRAGVRDAVSTVVQPVVGQEK